MSVSYVRTASLAIALLAPGCTGNILGSAPPSAQSGSGDVSPCSAVRSSNSVTEQIRVGLAPTCAGCHTSGQTGYFASATAFESLLVSNARLIKPGKPDESELVHLLEGRRMGSSLTQMPISGVPFARLDDAGKTSIHLQQVKEWIVTLQPPGVVREPSPLVASVQRVDATYIELGLRDLLGLAESDFYGSASDSDVQFLTANSDDDFDVRSPDRAPELLKSRGRYGGLGGASAASSAHEDRTISTGFIQTLVPVAQAWCAKAIKKQGNTALYTAATPAIGMADQPKVRKQLADWYLLFLSEQPSEAELDALVTGVFAPLESSSGIETAWVGTCSYFVRHPLFIFY